MQGIDHVLEPGRVLAVTAAGLGDVGRFLEGPLQGLVARADHDARAVVGLGDGDADAAPHDAAGALGDGLGDAQGQFAGIGEADGLQADVQQAGEQFRPGGDGVIAGHGHIVRVFAGFHQGLQDGHVAAGDGDDGFVEVTAQELAGPAAAQDHVHALGEQASGHGQGLLHGGQADFFQRPAVFLGIGLDFFCHHSGVGNEGEGKGGGRHMLSCSGGMGCGPPGVPVMQVQGAGARRGGRQTACFSGYPLSVFSSVICIFSFLSIGCLAKPRLSMQVRDRRSLRRSRSGRGGVVCPAAGPGGRNGRLPGFCRHAGPGSGGTGRHGGKTGCYTGGMM